MSNVAFLGIDVSKGYADFQLLGADKERLEAPFQLDDNRQGHQQLHRLLSEAVKKHQLQQLYCGVESTGGYENNWYYRLQHWRLSLPLRVRRINPKGVKHEIQAALQRTITDGVSAYYIGLHLINHFNKVFRHENGQASFSSARGLYNYIQLLIKQRTRLLNQLEKLLYQTFPEVLSYCREQMPRWVLLLLEQFPSAAHLAQAELETLCTIPYVSQGKAQQLQELARQSVAGRADLFSAHTVQCICQNIRQLNAQIEQQKSFLCQSFRDPRTALLGSIKGLGEYSAVALILEIEDIKRFDRASRLACYFGLNPTFKQSGDGKWRTVLSKQGRASARATLYMCAHNVVLNEPYFKDYYARFRAKGFKHKQAMGVVMHKLCRIIFGILKNEQPFDEKVDLKNIAQNQQKNVQKPSTSATLRRFQEESDQAPISRRKLKQRREGNQPQVPNKDECEVLAPPS